MRRDLTSPSKAKDTSAPTGLTYRNGSDNDTEIEALVKWHLSQIKFHRQAIYKIPGYLTWKISRTLRKYNRKLMDNVTQTNVLWKRTTSAGVSPSGKITRNALKGGSSKV